MQLADLLDPDLVLLQLSASTKRETIERLVDLIGHKFPELSKDEVIELVFEREDVESTSLGRGLAFPHARLDSITHLVFAVAVTEKGLPEKTIDGKPLRVICLFLTPRHMARLYLQTMSALAIFVRTEGNLERLYACQSPQQLLELFQATRLEVRKDLVARDIMRAEVIKAPQQMTLKEVANLLFKHRISGIPVVNEKDEVVGEVTEKELIKAAIPNYTRLVDNVRARLEVDPFETLIQKEDKITAGDLMASKFVTRGEETPVVELAALMLLNNVRRVEIVKDNKLVGIVVRSDIVNKIIRG